VNRSNPVSETPVPEAAVHSAAALAKASGAALLAALVLLFVFVLPAEYGYDPLKTGALLGLTGISQARDTPKGATATPAPGKTGVFRAEPAVYKVESEDFGLGPGEGMEMKYHMKQGAEMVYSWKADAPLQYEFHGEPDNKPRKDYFESYELDDKAGKAQMNGSFTAPTTGIHGWFWKNAGKSEIKLHLTVAGYFDSAKMIADGSTEEMAIDDAR